MVFTNCVFNSRILGKLELNPQVCNVDPVFIRALGTVRMRRRRHLLCGGGRLAVGLRLRCAVAKCKVGGDVTDGYTSVM